jgi:DNA-binding GntR family transcriptional regulator
MTGRDGEAAKHVPQSRIAADTGAVGAGNRATSIHQSIRRAVIEQRLPPGMRLPEDQIGGLFGASRTLVRAALQHLVRDGIVTLSRNRGAFVASPSVDEARQVFEARRVIESVTVARAAARFGPVEAADLEAMLAAERRAMTEGDRGTAIRLSGEFHLAIAAIGRQAVLQGFLAELVSRSSLVIALYGRGYRSACADEEHRLLLEALRAQDSEGAARQMSTHLDHIEADLDLKPRPRRMVSLADALLPPDRLSS